MLRNDLPVLAYTELCDAQLYGCLPFAHRAEKGCGGGKKKKRGHQRHFTQCLQGVAPGLKNRVICKL